MTHHWMRRVYFLLLGMLFIIILGAVLSVVGRNFLVDLWWFDSLGYYVYFWQRMLYRYAVFAAVGLVFFAIFFLNFWIASRFLRASKLAGDTRSKSRRQRLKKLVWHFRKGSLYFYTPISVALGILIALPMFRKWQEFLFYIFGENSGVTDPVYGKDISYYLFSYPIYTLIQHRLVFAFIVLFCALTIMYWLESRVLARSGELLARGAKWHLSAIILVIFLLEIWYFILQRYGLLYGENHLPRFYGPGFVEMRYVLPMIWLSLLSLAGVAFSLIIFIHRRKGWIPVCVFGLLFALFFYGRQSSSIMSLLHKYVVTPNEMTREWNYMNNNIKATLAAYKLQNVEFKEFIRPQQPQEIAIPHVKTLLDNVPVWDKSQLKDVYQQLQELRTYYTFNTVNVGRYVVNGQKKQVFLSGRELDYTHLPSQAKNWINEHLSYTHGYGAVMTPASQVGGEPMIWFISGIPPQSDFGLSIEQPGIYYGLGGYHYVIAPNADREIDYPKGNDNIMTDYSGRGGVALSSFWRRLVFAYYYFNRNLFFTTKITPESKILFRRNLLERVRTLTPYLMLDKTPYLVVTSKKLFWIQDAYTTSAWYPYSMPNTLHDKRINYLRNSVKIVLNAYDGTVDYYIADPEDPIIRAYSRMYPGVFKPLSQMPDDIRAHIRYPQDIFETQMLIYAKYHQTDPEVFYQNEDVWEPAKIPGVPEAATGRPYYATLDLIKPEQLDFLLLMPMLPRSRNNLRALTLAGCDGDNYGRIIIYNFPKGELFFGPSQMAALINENTHIAKDFTLWDQAGSKVARGQMIILPVGNAVFYIQPVYLQAIQLNIPELQRVIMGEGQTVVMTNSLLDSYFKLKQVEKEEKIEEGNMMETPGPEPSPKAPEASTAAPAPSGEAPKSSEQPRTKQK